MKQQRFDTPNPVRLEVRCAAGDIEVTTVDGEESTVLLEGSERAVQAMRVGLSGDRLTVEEHRKSGLRWFGGLQDALRVQVQVPHASRVEIATASADAKLDGRFGELKAQSTSGDLDVTGEIGGQADVRTVSGDARLPDVHGDLSVRTVSGDLDADSVDASIQAKSVSGDVRVSSLREGHVNVESVSGDVGLGIAAGTTVDVDAVSASGELSSEVPLSDAPTGEAGPTLVIRAKTVSGDVRLSRARPVAATLS